MDNKQRLNEILSAFKIEAECITYSKIRNVSLYDLSISPGVRINSLNKFAEEISLALKSKSKPIIKVLPEQGIVRLEIIEGLPHKISYFNEIDKIAQQDATIPIYLGSSIDGQDMIMDMVDNPHILIAGTTGSGKSTLLHTLLANLFQNRKNEFFIIDTKCVEFEIYRPLKNVNMANNYSQALSMLNHLHGKMEDRYNLLRTNFISQKDIHNQLGSIFLVIDEFADLVMQDGNKFLRNSLCKLTQKCRAAGIYCILATQRPSADVLSGSVKANFPARIACQVASNIDAKVILGITGAELLAGNGDAIIKNYKYNYQRFQTAYSSPIEILKRFI